MYLFILSSIYDPGCAVLPVTLLIINTWLSTELSSFDSSIDVKKCIIKISVIFNKLIAFKTELLLIKAIKRCVCNYKVR